MQLRFLRIEEITSHNAHVGAILLARSQRGGERYQVFCIYRKENPHEIHRFYPSKVILSDYNEKFMEVKYDTQV